MAKIRPNQHGRADVLATLATCDRVDQLGIVRVEHGRTMLRLKQISKRGRYIHLIASRDATRSAGHPLSTPADEDRWTVLVPRLPADPSRYRVAVWRELRRIGAVQLGQGTWALPTTATTADDVARIRELAQGSAGEVLVLSAVGFDGPSRDRIRAAFDEARSAEWHEFDRECDKCVAEIQREIGQRKFTLAELDEEEQNVERLRRWHRELRVRDRFEAGDRARMDQRLQECAELLAQFTDLVYAEVGLT